MLSKYTVVLCFVFLSSYSSGQPVQGTLTVSVRVAALAPLVHTQTKEVSFIVPTAHL